MVGVCCLCLASDVRPPRDPATLYPVSRGTSSSSTRPSLGSSKSSDMETDYYADFERSSRDQSLDESNIGMGMLKNMGWKAGTGLGADR